MARTIDRLTAREVRNAKPRLNDDGRPIARMISDGLGLYLHVSPEGAKSWIYRYTLNGKTRWMGLGPVSAIGLAEARERVRVCHRQRHDGIDPIDARKEQRQRKQAAAKTMTFRQCATAYIEAHRKGWRNPKHAAQWPSTLETYIYPVFGDLPVQAIDEGLVVKALAPIWSTKTETATRVRQRVEAALEWAKVMHVRAGDNPARWKGCLENLLPKPGKVRKSGHHAALPFPEIGAFVAALRGQEGIAARALEFAILTAGRTGEVLGARGSEIDLADRIWIISAERMKAHREHRVPLAPPAIAVLQQMAQLQSSASSEFVFPGAVPGRPISNMAMLMLLRRMGRGELTAHGFRSSFRDWAAERTNFPPEVAEMALAHTVADKVEAAYRCGDLVHKWRQLMDAWAQQCDQVKTSDVVPLRVAAR